MPHPNHTVLHLWIRRVPRGPMETQEMLTLEAGKGVVGDYVYGRKRHVTIVFADEWNDAAREIGREVDPAGRRGNVLVDGRQRGQFTPGTRVRLGAAELEIRGITLPCENMENAAPGMRRALEPEDRGGVWGVVLVGGVVRAGDELRVVVDVAAGSAPDGPAPLDR